MKMKMDRIGRHRRRGRNWWAAGATLLFMAGCSALENATLTQGPEPPQAAPAAGSPQDDLQRLAADHAENRDAADRDAADRDAADRDVASLRTATTESLVGSDIAQVSNVKLVEPLASAESEESPSDAVRRASEDPIMGTQVSTEEPDTGQPLPEPASMPDDRYPIDLPAALQLGGANHMQIAVAAEQVREAASRLDRAEVMWVPSLNFGVGYNRHDGQIQATEGDVINVSRSSTFVGGGPNVGSAPLTGPSGGPPRLFVGLNPAEAYFQPLAERRAVQAASAERAVTFNDALLEVGLAYYELIAAQMRAAIATETLQNTQELVQLTESFEEAGAGLAADTARARAQLARVQMEQLEAEEEVRVSSAELTRLLRLEPEVVLYPAQTVPVPVTLVSTETPLSELIAQGLGNRPELARHRALVAEAQQRLRLEQWRPLIPNLQVGNSFGGFGGGPNSFFGDFETRNDFDALAVWEVENFGLGNGARRRERASEQRRERLRQIATLDRIAAEISEAHSRAQIKAEQIEVAKTLVVEASEALPLNLQAIRGGQLSPIEAQQATSQLADARQQYLRAVIEYDRAQLQLLRAIGNPPDPQTAGTPESPPEPETLPTPPLEAPEP